MENPDLRSRLAEATAAADKAQQELRRTQAELRHQLAAVAQAQARYAAVQAQMAAKEKGGDPRKMAPKTPPEQPPTAAAPPLPDLVDQRLTALERSLLPPPGGHQPFQVPRHF